MQKKTLKRVAWSGFAAALALAIGAGAVGFAAVPSMSAAPVRDLNGNTVQLDDDGAASLDSVQSHPIADTGARFMVPSAGLDVPLGQLNEVGGSVTPPGFTSVYRVANRGVDVAHASTGTVYVVTHSLRGGGVGPGNYLIDVDNARPAIDNGESIIVDGVEYVVDSAFAVDKSDLPAQADVWATEPGRLVVITCLQNPQSTASTQNVVIEAHLADSPSPSDNRDAG
ncbi:class F sortase [Microbacterium sp. KKR3/1]|uniref:class F sortase n=1 Tax=Microbacterium sp. KKR3/1 TaxID=2904241 RepID=UPI001E47BF7C|nr:class F sortase [Microbacterium sp. KKR3/1]MCE0510784.1 class F sortase [Microbacterium sp. KKR3/1]